MNERGAVPVKWDSLFCNIYNSTLFCKLVGDMICLPYKSLQNYLALQYTIRKGTNYVINTNAKRCVRRLLACGYF